jgi:hypothetical protein
MVGGQTCFLPPGNGFSYLDQFSPLFPAAYHTRLFYTNYPFTPLRMDAVNTPNPQLGTYYIMYNALTCASILGWFERSPIACQAPPITLPSPGAVYSGIAIDVTGIQ